MSFPFQNPSHCISRLAPYYGGFQDLSSKLQSWTSAIFIIKVNTCSAFSTLLSLLCLPNLSHTLVLLIFNLAFFFFFRLYDIKYFTKHFIYNHYHLSLQRACFTLGRHWALHLVMKLHRILAYQWPFQKCSIYSRWVKLNSLDLTLLLSLSQL